MSIMIGTHIRAMLTKSTDVTALAGNRIFPLAVPEGVSTYPFVVYYSDGISTDYDKDGGTDRTQVTVEAVGKTYETAVRLAQACREALENKGAKYEKFEVCDCELKSSTEVYDDAIAAYIISVSYTMEE